MHRSQEIPTVVFYRSVHLGAESIETGLIFSINLNLQKMETKLFKVVSQSEVTYVPSSKEVNGQRAQCEIRLKMLGGSKFSDEFVATLFGNLALSRFNEGDVVVAVLRFSVHEVNGAGYQDVVCGDYVRLNA